PVLRHAAVLEARRRLGVVAANHVERPAVGPQAYRVRAVLATAVDRLELLDRVEHIVVLGRCHAVQPAARPAVAHDVERVLVPQEALRPGECALLFVLLLLLLGRELRPGYWRQLQVQPLYLRLLVGADLARRDADEALAVLIAGDEPALVVSGQGHPRAE